MSNARNLAAHKNSRFFSDKPCPDCSTNRYYTINGRCVECQRIYAKSYISPKQKLVKARGAFAKAFLRENKRCALEKKREFEKYPKHPEKRIKYPPYGYKSKPIYKQLVKLQKGCCAYCGDTKGGLTLDVIDPNRKPHWHSIHNLQLLCDKDKVAKWESGLSDVYFRRACGIPSATAWDVL